MTSISNFHNSKTRSVGRRALVIYGFRKLARKYLPSRLKPRKSVLDVVTELSVSTSLSKKEYKTASGAVYRVEIDSNYCLSIVMGSESAQFPKRSTSTDKQDIPTAGSPIAY